MKAAFRQPGFGLLFTGLLASMAGDSLMLIVLAVWVKDLTGSNGAAGLTFFFLAAPALLAPLAGIYVDRLKRRTVLLWGNITSAVAVLPLLLVRTDEQVWLIYAVAVLYGVSFVVLPAALNGLLKEMLPDDLLVDANASLSTTKEALRLVGPLAGAGLFSLLGGAGVAAIDAASFVIAAGVIGCLSVPEEQPVREEGRWRDEFLAGVRHIRSDRVLTHTLLATGLSLLVIGFMESAVFAMVDAFGKPATFVGVVVSVQGVGAIAGGVTSSRVIRRVGETTAIGLSLVILAVGLAVCAVSASLAGVFVGVAVLGYALPVFIVAFNTLLQLRTPQRLMGRVSAATDVVLGTPQATSIAVGALLVSLISFRDIYWVCSTVILAAAAYLTVALGGEPQIPAEPASTDTVVGKPPTLL
ncbi:MAG: MFS transporter [Nocardioidaceae bacterium]|nr:MFS transporter [Nocardioidaceae bacterium]